MSITQLNPASAYRWTALGQGGSAVVQLVAAVPLSRLLGPSAFGLAAVAIFIYTALGIVVDTGVTSSVARTDSVDDNTLFHLHSLALGLAVTGSAVVWALRRPVAALLVSDSLAPTLAEYLPWLTIAIVGMAWQAVPRGLLIRRHDFRRLALADLAAMLISYVVAVVLAIVDRSSAAPLVAQIVTMGAARGVLFELASRYVPRASLGRSDLGAHLAFLRHNWIFTVSTFSSRNVDNVIVVKTLGTSSLGLYGRAFSLFLAPFTQLQYSLANIMLRYFAPDQCPRAEFARSRYLRLFAALFLVSSITSLYVAIDARQITLLLFGGRWLGCVPLIRAFSCALFVQLELSPALWFLQARGPGRGLVVIGVANMTPLVAVLIGGLLGSLTLVAWLYASVAVIANLMMCLVIVSRQMRITLRSQCAVVARLLGPVLLYAVAASAIAFSADLESSWTLGINAALALGVLAMFRDVLRSGLSIAAEPAE